MPYEIPQKLQYEEKIVFGLTFRQLVYALIFIMPSLIIFLKTDLNIYVKATITSILVSFGVSFMFFDLSNYIKNLYSWFRAREMWIMGPKMTQFLGVEKIEEGVIYVWKTKKPVKK